MSNLMDILDYLRLPRTDVSRAVALGESLVTAVPDEAPPPVTECAGKLQVATVLLSKQYDQREEVEGAKLRQFDFNLDHAWGALYGALQSTLRIPFPSPEKEQAKELMDKLFSDGLGFVKESYQKQWFESARRLRRIEEKKYEAPLAQATGSARYLDAVRLAHDAYAKALNITEADSDELDSNLADGIGAVRDAVTLYVAQVIAWAQQDGGRYLDKGYQALRPIDAARDAAARAVASGSESGNDQETTEGEKKSESETPEAETPAESSEAADSDRPAADSNTPPAPPQTPEVPNPEEEPGSAA